MIRLQSLPFSIEVAVVDDGLDAILDRLPFLRTGASPLRIETVPQVSPVLLVPKQNLRVVFDGLTAVRFGFGFLQVVDEDRRSLECPNHQRFPVRLGFTSARRRAAAAPP